VGYNGTSSGYWGSALEEESGTSAPSSSPLLPDLEVRDFAQPHILAKMSCLTLGPNATGPTDHRLKPPKL
jgi:hypothetical protein